MKTIKYWIDKDDLNNKAINTKFNNYKIGYSEFIWNKLGTLIHNNYTTTLPLYTAYKLLESEEFFYIFNLSYYNTKNSQRNYLIFDKKFYNPFIKFIFNIAITNLNNGLFGKYIKKETKNDIIRKYNLNKDSCTIENYITPNLYNNGFMDFNEVFNLIYKMHCQDLEFINDKSKTITKITNSNLYKQILKNTIFSKYLLDHNIFEKYLFGMNY